MPSEWERILERIERLRARERAITIDGVPEDWEGFHWIRTEVGRTESGQPIAVLLAVAPTSEEVAFCLRPERPIDGWLAGWDALNVSLETSSSDLEGVELSLSPRRAWVRHMARDEVSKWSDCTLAVVQAWGNCIEARVRLRQLARHPNDPVIDSLVNGARHPWLRVLTTLEKRSSGARDGSQRGARRTMGPASASYRLDPDPPLPSWASPRNAEKPLGRIDWFLAGKWLVQKGPEGWESHVGRVAYDFDMRDSRHSNHRGERPERLEDFLAWDAELRSPVAGVVWELEGNHPDPPLATDSTWRQHLDGVRMRSAGMENFIDVRVGELHWSFAHLKQGSISAALGARLASGDPIGRIGSSGRSEVPHLHLHVRPRTSLRTGAVALERVRVGLNAVDDDPWEVNLQEWTIEAGYFVRSAVSPK